MIDREKVERLIDERKHFIIGARGIMVECYPKGFGWVVSIPRAFFRAEADTLSMDSYVLVLGVEAGYVESGRIDLGCYTKVTVMCDDM